MDIFQAIRENNVARVRELIEDRNNLNLQDLGQSTPLMQAALSRNLEITRILLEKGASPNFHGFYESPLNIATQNNNLEIDYYNQQIYDLLFEKCDIMKKRYV